jgi:hypothetical protein
MRPMSSVPVAGHWAGHHRPRPAMPQTCGRDDVAPQYVTCKDLHNILKGILRSDIHRAGVASSLEPAICRLPSQATGGAPVCDGTVHGDIVLVLRDAVTVADMLVIQPQGVDTLTAAAGTPGVAAAHKDSQKNRVLDGTHSPGDSRQVPRRTGFRRRWLRAGCWSLTGTLSCRSRWRL